MQPRPLRICQVLSYFFPLQSGAERQALEQGAELVRQGHTVHVLTRQVAGLSRHDLVRGVHVHRAVRLTRVGPLFGLSFVTGYARAIERLSESFDVVHTHQALWEGAAAGLARRWINQPTLVQPASSRQFGEAEELRRTRGSSLLRRLILANTHFAAISKEIASEWSQLGVESDRMTMMASGVDTQRFRPGPSAVERLLPPRPRVIFAGRLHPQKNLGVLLEAWRTVRKHVPAHLVLLGDGPERTQIESVVREEQLAGSVHLLGAVADPADYLRGADVFVLPSVAEGMSNAVLEAMATGLPCLVSAIGGNEDLIAEGRVGFCLPSMDARAWSDALVRLLQDADLRQEMGEAARSRATQEFGIERVVGRYVGLYRNLTGIA